VYQTASEPVFAAKAASARASVAIAAAATSAARIDLFMPSFVLSYSCGQL
jgi:hypothetical protein